MMTMAEVTKREREWETATGESAARFPSALWMTDEQWREYATFMSTATDDEIARYVANNEARARAGVAELVPQIEAALTRGDQFTITPNWGSNWWRVKAYDDRRPTISRDALLATLHEGSTIADAMAMTACRFDGAPPLTWWVSTRMVAGPSSDKGLLDDVTWSALGPARSGWPISIEIGADA